MPNPPFLGAVYLPSGELETGNVRKPLRSEQDPKEIVNIHKKGAIVVC